VDGRAGSEGGAAVDGLDPGDRDGGDLNQLLTESFGGILGERLCDLLVQDQRVGVTPGLGRGFLASPTGVIGGFLGTLLLGKIGPTIFDINLIPAFIGAALIAVVAEVMMGSRSRAVR